MSKGLGSSSKRVRRRGNETQSDVSSLDSLPSNSALERLRMSSASSASPKMVRLGGRGQIERSTVVSLGQSARPAVLKWDFDDISENG
jgi:hypothetical protein